MIKVAIVGNIASGKSEVEKILSIRGYKVADCDKIAHTLLENNIQVINAFKNYDILESGKIAREKLGKLVFSHPELKKELENIIHPQVQDAIKKFFENNKTEKITFVAVPLLFEVGLENLFDKIIFVYANDKIRLKRLIERNNYSEEYAKIRLNSQLPQEEKISKSDFVIYNEKSLANLEKEVDDLLKLIEI